MNDTTQPIEDSAPNRTITLAILFSVAGLLCLFFIAAFLFFQPNQLSLADQYFPSPTATLTPTPTPTPTLTPTPTPNLTATQQVIRSTATARVIQALATDSINQWPVLFSDTFDSNKNNWPTGSDDDEYAKSIREFKNGKYNWDVTAKKGFMEWVSANTRSLNNFHLSAEIKQVSGSSQSDYGLVFRQDVDHNLYYFGIDDEGFFVLLNYDDEWADMIEFTKSSAILPEGTNRLTVIAEGSHFVFFINDQFVGEMTNDRVQTGTTAVAIELYEKDLQATFEFDNFELRAP